MKIKFNKKVRVALIIVVTLILLSLSIFIVLKIIENQTKNDNIKYIQDIVTNDENRNEFINLFKENHDLANEELLGIEINSEKALGILEISSINFKDIVLAGTTESALANGIGLFEHSNIYSKNVCLAGHNSNRFFANLHKAKLNDEIKYTSVLGTRQYKIDVIEQINDTDWNYLNETDENKITIITCVKGKPSLRLCVQGTEI